MKILNGLRSNIIILIVFACFAVTVLAKEAINSKSNVHVILSGDAPIYEIFYAELESKLLPRFILSRSFAEDWSQDNKYPILISVGARALEKIVAHGQGSACLSVLIPSNKFTSDVKGSLVAQSMLQQGKLSAIYMEQPPARQLNLARLVKPGLKSVGTIYDRYSDHIANQLAESAARMGIKFQKRSLKKNDNPVAVLRKMYADIDVFLALPGKYIFHRATAKWMLYLSYQNRKPLLGFSADYVEAGAFAAVYSEPGDLALQTAEWIEALQRNDDKFGAPSYPTYFKVSINKQVAARISLELLSEAQLSRKLRLLEMSQ